ncbi:double-strand break repair helicase AddA [Roseobacter denitrificans]|uniref:DNA 3'-5' helicase n=1 Tax=Roseobacter denitrificans (strain ATCC 33942 / OCh 114) TaxID=375451 RepID=Q16CX8_ROSDO|nr:double-strand break repair helicase AddA [Roseobacter denitrificans]ABG30165.1 ATP-dependent DNA nuclease, putative [Roseobacter denitrificans OCh 114]AVL53355.1 double-strand break repair helicase AddA [Roseobacter denitrificans]SFF70186.1 DNA helicase/exodeoxyribonuclease V, subunit A [Roseobacter denitrificans OCh 114]
MTPRHPATQAQVDAARPDASTWLAANAGSGKTRVLTDRVARLLLDKVAPEHILCLTYTKAAASEMQNRLFKRLGEWAMLQDDALAEALRDLGVETAVDAEKLRKARTLFARAIETPGGLKIQTIHSFCASLLRRFPLEARVSPQFTEIEERAADLLRAEIIDTMAEGPDAAVIADLAQHYTGENFVKLAKAVVQHKDGFRTPLSWEESLALFDQPADLTAKHIEDQVFLGDEAALFDTLIPPMQAKGGNDAKTAVKLKKISGLNFSALPALEEIFLTGRKAKPPFRAKIGTLPTKPTQDVVSDAMPALDDFMCRVETARDARVGLLAAQKTYALHRFAGSFLPLYEEQKTLRGWLDFDDLIDRARALLSDEDVAAWVLFRIDGGIDHILVDEAQDTSPAQWDVIRKLAAEFTSGEGARQEVQRTVFVVGDKKQSIYSFQGADPREFDRMQAEFASKIEAAEQLFQNKTLAFSFRSASAILGVVDRTFDGLTDAGFTTDEQHIAFKQTLPGRVDIWPVVEPQPSEEDRAWHDPIDRKAAHHHSVILAERVATQIKAMIAHDTIPDEKRSDGKITRRPVQAGDFLILVQRRSVLFTEIIRACKNKDLDIAGADRLKVGGELAVRDLAALLSFLAVPEDSLSLASTLRSPLFGWSEKELFQLAHHREHDHLWQALRMRSDAYPETLKVLRDLRANVDFLRPYDLIERILTRHNGRRNLLARLGVEAEDGINALLSQALAYERNAVPSLTGFLVWMETDDLEIKRQIDSASNQIRVMTVHGAKGLEAPIVILPDSGKRNNPVRDDIIILDDKPVWKTPANDTPGAMAAALDEIAAAQAAERLRLLYVALTRAEKWLIVAAAGELSKQNDTWYQRVDAAVDAAGARLVDMHGLAVKRHQKGDWEALPLSEANQNTTVQATLDPCFTTRAPARAPLRETVSPSDLGGAKALPGEAGQDEEAAKAYGTSVHLFLEHLSAADPSDWPALVDVLSDNGDPDLLRAASEAKTVLQDPNLAHLFTPDSLAEVAVTAEFGSARLHGIIDRLVVSDTAVLAVDFKTNQTVPSQPATCPEGILRQMGAYTHALKQVYPDRKIETAILWTRNCTLMHLPHDIVTQALQNTLYLDDGATPS